MTRASQTIVGILQDHARRDGARLALTFLRRGEIATDGTTYAELDQHARAVAACLRAADLAGKGVLLITPPGIDFVRCFLGCLYAGAYAIPVPYAQRGQGMERTLRIAEHARPHAVLSPQVPDAAMLDRINLPGGRRPMHITPLDALAHVPLDIIPEPAADAPAFIQYTSGSTRAPKGIVVTHRNIVANQEMIRSAFGHDRDTIVVSWLPLHHDMGLIGSILQPLYLSAKCILMSPLDFLQRPVRWLRAISTYRATTSGAPNFAYDLCARHISDADAADLDLSSWKLAFCGSEPVRHGTMQRFADRFAASRFSSDALYPCYGLAEATLFVAGREHGSRWMTRTFDRRHFAALTADATMQQPLVCCGRPRGDGQIVIIDTSTSLAAPEGEIGEICVAGQHVSPGEWSASSPGGILPHTERMVRIAQTDYLRTGDAGVMASGELFVVGRLKDMVIVRGVNIFAEDVEDTLMSQAGASQVTAAAAVAVEGTATEELVILCEIERESRGMTSFDERVKQWRSAVADLHGVQGRIVLVAPGALPRTTSGKIQRGAARSAYLDGTLPLLK